MAAGNKQCTSYSSREAQFIIGEEMLPSHQRPIGFCTCGRREQDLKADCDVSEFSCRNAHFFATMSATAYSSKDDVKTFFQGNETMSGLGFEHFKWFEVSIISMLVRPVTAGSNPA